MSEFWQGILVGAVLAIPVGIVTNLVTLPIQMALTNRIRVTSIKKAAENQAFHQQTETYARDRSALWSYLLEVLLRSAFIGALAGVVSGFFVIVGQGMGATDYLHLYLRAFEYLQPVAYIAAQIAALIGALAIMNMARDALQVLRAVRELRMTSQAAPPTSP